MNEIISGIASSVLYDLGKAALKDFGSMFGRLKNVFGSRKSAMVFVPEAAGLSNADTAQRKLMIRLILLGSASWTKEKLISMEPDLQATIFPPGNGHYYFSKPNTFVTPAIAKGMHAYFLGEQELKSEHKGIDAFTSKVGVIFSGTITVEGLGKIPVFPLTLLAGSMGGFVNEPIELKALKQQS